MNSENPFDLITQQTQSDAVTVIQQDDSQFVPNASWSLDELKSSILYEHEVFSFFSRKTAFHAFCLGRVLTFAKDQVEKGTWGQFLKEVGISVTTDNRCRMLYEFIGSEEALDGLTITEAYEQAGVKLGKKTQAQSATVPITVEDSDYEVELSDSNGTDESNDDESDFVEDTDFEESEADDEDSDLEDTDFDESDDGDIDLHDSDEEPDEIPKPHPKETAPPKEEPDNFGMRMAQLVDRARWLAERIDGVVVKPSEADHWLSQLVEVRTLLTVIEGGLSHV